MPRAKKVDEVPAEKVDEEPVEPSPEPLPDGVTGQDGPHGRSEPDEVVEEYPEPPVETPYEEPDPEPYDESGRTRRCPRGSLL